MKRMKRITLLLTLAAALCAAASCVENLGVDGGAVNFGATMGGALTKTAYSGTVTGDKEAIHWVSSDQILILCEQANGDKSKAYGITPNTSDRTKADKVTPVGGKGLQWGTEPTHYFHAAYPSTVSLSSASSPENSSIFTASIPDGQGGEWKGKEYEPNMSYAYMYAATSSAADAAQVNLTFKPLMTAFRFEIKSDPTDPFPAGTKLTKVELSASTDLAGEFTAVIAPDGTLSGPVSVTPSSAKQSLSINLGSTGVELDKDPRAFTFFALPVLQKELTLKLTFNDGGDEFTRSLALKNSGASITVAACTKLRITGLGVTPSGFTGTTNPYNPGNHGIVSDDFAFTVTPSTATLWTTEDVTLSASSSALPAPTYTYHLDNTYVTLSTTSGASTRVIAGSDAGRSVVTVKAKRGDDTNTKEYIFPVVVRKLESVTLLPTLRIAVGAYPATLTPDVRHHNGTNSNQPYYGGDWTWSVLDPNTDTEVTGIVTVSKGVVTAVAPGTVRVRCSITKGGITKFDDCLVTVDPSGTPEAYNVTGNGGIQ